METRVETKLPKNGKNVSTIVSTLKKRRREWRHPAVSGKVGRSPTTFEPPCRPAPASDRLGVLDPALDIKSLLFALEHLDHLEREIHREAEASAC